MPATIARHAPTNTPLPDDADTRPVEVLRTDAIDAAGALKIAAIQYRKEAKLRRNGGGHNAAHRRWLRALADQFDAAAVRVQRAADEAI